MVTRNIGNAAYLPTVIPKIVTPAIIAIATSDKSPL